MNQPVKTSAAPCLVVHDSPFVAQDLSEILMSCGASEVQMVRKPSEVAIDSASVVIITNTAFASMPGEIVAQWRAGCVPIVVLDGLPLDEPCIRAVQQPFRSEDIAATLRDMKVF